MMYDELIEELRRHHCDAKEDDTQEICEECAYDVIIADKSVPSGIASVCVCGLMNRAADAIEELRKAVLQLEDESGIYDELPMVYIHPTKWIPVTERLPENEVTVLVVRKFLGIKDCPAKTYVETAEYCYGDWVADSDEYKIARSKHTDPLYWMPLPKPPKDGE